MDDSKTINETQEKKHHGPRRHGPAPWPQEKKRRCRVNVFFRTDELEELTAKAGGKQHVSSFLRAAGLGRRAGRVIAVPPQNQRAYQELARSTANLNQLTALCNAAGEPAEMLKTKIAEIDAELDVFRRRLIGEELLAPEELADEDDEEEGHDEI